MSRFKWRKYQRRKKAEKESVEKVMAESNNNHPQFKEAEEKKSVERKLFYPKGEKPKEKVPEHLPKDYMLTNDFDSGSESSLAKMYLPFYASVLIITLKSHIKH